MAIKTGVFHFDLNYFANFYNDSDSVGILGILKTLHDTPAYFTVFAAPVLYAGAKTLWTVAQHSHPTEGFFNERIAVLKNKSPAWDMPLFNGVSLVPFLNMLLLFHPMKRKMPALATLILWEGHLKQELRERAFNALCVLAKTRTGYSQMVAIEALGYLAHGMHVKNLAQGPHNVPGLLKIKIGAFLALLEVYKALPYCSLNKLRTASLLWEIGQSPSWRVSVVEPIVKLLKVAFYFYGLYGIADALYKFITGTFKDELQRRG